MQKLFEVYRMNPDALDEEVERGVALPAATQARLAEIERAHHQLPKPDNLGRKIEIKT